VIVALPESRPEDDEDVVWGLSTATALWARGERRDAIVWLRRAADAAVAAGQEFRGSELGMYAGELEETLNAAGANAEAAAVGDAAPASAEAAAPDSIELLDIEADRPSQISIDLEDDVVAPPAPPPPGRLALTPGPVPPPRSAFPPPVAVPPPAAPLPARALPSSPAPKPITAAPPVAASTPVVAIPPPAPLGVTAPQPGPQAMPHAFEMTPMPASPMLRAEPTSSRRLTPTPRKSQPRGPILDPWADEPTDPGISVSRPTVSFRQSDGGDELVLPRRTQTMRGADGDDEVVTSAAPLDASLTKKVEPRPPRNRVARPAPAPAPGQLAQAAAVVPSKGLSVPPPPLNPPASAPKAMPPAKPAPAPPTPSIEAPPVAAAPAAVASPPAPIKPAATPVAASPAPTAKPSVFPPPAQPRPAPGAARPSAPPPPAVAAPLKPPPPAAEAVAAPIAAAPVIAAPVVAAATVAAPIVAAPTVAAASSPSVAPPAPAPQKVSVPPAPASVRPAKLSVPPPPALPNLPKISAGAAKSAPPAAPTLIDGLPLDEVDAFVDLPPEMQQRLVALARIEALSADEEVSSFGAALLLAGEASVCATIVDTPACRAVKGTLVPSRGSLSEAVGIRVVAGSQGARVAIWEQPIIEDALKSCPWVLDELVTRADRIQALAGATMGPLGEVDEAARNELLDRLTVHFAQPFESLVDDSGDTLGLAIVGGGVVELAAHGDLAAKALHPGETLFARAVIEGRPAPRAASAGASGALVLLGEAKIARELMASSPPLAALLGDASD
jgi:hypothetical protein